MTFDERITRSELQELFGASMPIEAAMLLFGEDDGRDLDEIRAKLVELAEHDDAMRKAQRTIRRELIFRHYQAAREGEETERQRLFDLIVAFDQEFPEAEEKTNDG